MTTPQFTALSGTERRSLESRYGSAALTELADLSRERDPALQAEGIFSLAARLETNGRLQGAAELYSTLLSPAENSPATPSAITDRARTRLQAIQGVGGIGARSEFLLRRLASEASDPATLAGMAVAGGLANFARWGILTRLAASPTANFFTRGLGARLFAASGSLLLEAPAFTASLCGANALLGREQDWSGQALRNDLLSGALTLLSLRASGAVFGGLAERIGAGRVTRTILPQVATLGGLQLSRTLEQSLGLRPRLDGATTWIDSFATLLQFHVGGRLAESFMGMPSLPGNQAELLFRSGENRGPTSEASLSSWGRPRFAVAEPAPEFPLPGNFLRLGGESEPPGPASGSSTGTKSEGRVEETKSHPVETENEARIEGSRPRTVAIVGGGASGLLVAANLLRRAKLPLHVQLIDGGNPDLGPGAAYSTPHAEHLLNVPVEKMTAFPEDPEHFLRWAQNRDPSVVPGQFLPRRLFGQYLRDMLRQAEAVKAPGVRFTQLSDAAVAFENGGTGRLRLSSGNSVTAEQFVLAFGNARPANIPLEDPSFFASPRYSQDPFLRGGAEYLGIQEPILILGTGLTMVDVATSLFAQGHPGPIYAVSRHGWLPQAHAPATVFTTPAEAAELYDGKSLQETRAILRAQVEKANAIGSNWRAAVDALRPITNVLWTSWSPAEQTEFLSKYARSWDIHRHRIPPSSAAQIRGWIEQGRLRILKGQVTALRDLGIGVQASIRSEAQGARTLSVAHVVNATGADTDYHRLRKVNPLVGSLLDQGLMQVDPLRLGLQVDLRGSLVERSGRASPFLLTLGPPRKGRLFWETTAIPEIRSQAPFVAGEILRRFGDTR